jgi:hypothetical protein
MSTSSGLKYVGRLDVLVLVLASTAILVCGLCGAGDCILLCLKSGSLAIVVCKAQDYFRQGLMKVIVRPREGVCERSLIRISWKNLGGTPATGSMYLCQLLNLQLLTLKIARLHGVSSEDHTVRRVS